MSRRSHPRSAAGARAIALSVLLAACADRNGEQRSAADSDLAHDLALVQSTATSQAIFRDTALTNAPERRTEGPTPPAPVTRPVPRPTPRRQASPTPQRTARPAPPRESPRLRRVAKAPPPEPARPVEDPTPAAERREAGAGSAGAIGAGSVLVATSNARVCTRSNLPGDRITATVNEPVRGTNGAEIPAGSKVVLEVASIDAAEPPANGQVVVRATSVAIGDESYPASGGGTMAGPLERTPGARSASSDRKKVVGGAIAGAILGQMMGRDTRSTVIGAAAGAAAGTAAAKMGDQGEACLAAGTPIRIVLDEAVVFGK
jgi:hypothetical protein